MNFTINGHKMTTGSVTSGTLKTEDLVKAFSDEVRRLCLTRPDILLEAECWLKGPQEYADNDFTEAYPNDTIEDAHEVCGPNIAHDLVLHLNAMAPDNIRFGSHEGDSADYGWWEYE